MIMYLCRVENSFSVPGFEAEEGSLNREHEKEKSCLEATTGMAGQASTVWGRE